VKATMHSISKHRLANITGIPRIINWSQRQRLLVVTYHGLFNRHEDAALLPPTFIHVAHLKAQLNFLKDRYRMIRPEDLIEAVVTGRRLPNHAALVTFDDAYENFYELAAPLLESLDIVPVVFVPTLYVETRQPFWYDLVWYFLQNGKEPDRRWLSELMGVTPGSTDSLTEKCLRILKKMSFKERNDIIEPLENRMGYNVFIAAHSLAMTPAKIRRLSARGFHFGGHTHTHTILTAADNFSVGEEIDNNKSILEAITGQKISLFAYPNGGVKDFTILHKEMLTRAGYVSAFSLIQKRASLTDPMAIPRINVAPEDDVDSFWFRCSAAASLISPIKEYLRAKLLISS